MKVLRQALGFLSGKTEAAAKPSETVASGNWPATAYATPDALAAYAESLGGQPRSTYDPNDFLRGTLKLGGELQTPGRRDEDLFRAFNVSDYRPDDTHLPKPAFLTRPAQQALLTLARTSPVAAGRLARAINTLAVKDSRGTLPLWGERLSGTKLAQSIRERYFGVVRRHQDELHQHGFQADIHEGSIARTGEGGFGTYDIAKRMGFSDEQARRIAREVYNVDTDETAYRDATGKAPRQTHGAQGLDLHWHYNRAREGEEDTRITAAREHLDRALEHAGLGEYDRAELELGVGLHSLQDLFSHGQIVPITHVALGEFPDIVDWTPVAAHESMLASEAYLGVYLERLGLSAELDTTMVIPGSVAPELESLFLALPASVQDQLREEGVQMVLATSERTPTSLGFGVDVDGSGTVEAGAQRDVDGDGTVSPYEQEGRRFDGAAWNDKPGGYDSSRRLLFVQQSVLGSAQAADVFRHEVAHPLVDRALRSDIAETTARAQFKQARDEGKLPNAPPPLREFLVERLLTKPPARWPEALEGLALGRPL